MSTPEDNTRINLNEDTIISAVPAEDTILTSPEEHTVISAVDESTVTTESVEEVQDTVISLEDTVLGVSDDTRVGVIPSADVEEAISAQDTAPQQEILTRFRLRHINGTEYLLTKPVVLGRMPTSPVRGDRGVTLVVLSSPDGVVSSTHAQVEVSGDVAVVTDLRSTNGTRVILPGKPTILLGPGDSMALPVGAILDLGDGNRIELLG